MTRKRKTGNPGNITATADTVTSLNPNDAKVENAADPRRQG